MPTDGVVIGAAAAAGERRRLMHDDAPAARGKLERGRQSGEAGADNVDRCSHGRMASHEIAQHDEQEFCARQANGRPRRRKAARHQRLENDAIGLAHDARRAHDAARALRHDRLCLAKVLLRQLDDAGAGLADRRMRQNRRADRSQRCPPLAAPRAADRGGRAPRPRRGRAGYW